MPYGVQIGDPLADGAVVWTRADRPSRMLVEIAPTESFRGARRIAGPLLDADWAKDQSNSGRLGPHRSRGRPNPIAGISDRE